MGILTGWYPDDIARGAVGGHGIWRNTIVGHQGGYETPNLDWQDARGEWNVARAIERYSKHEVARSHYYKARGTYHYFRFKDWLDFACARTGNDKGRLTGSGTAWQINKVYGSDDASFEYVRPLYRIKDSLQIWRNGSLQTLTTHYTVNMDTGGVTSAASWTGDTLEVACNFGVLCRYDTPQFAPRLVHRKVGGELLLQWADISIVEVREGQ